MEQFFNYLYASLNLKDKVDYVSSMNIQSEIPEIFTLEKRTLRDRAKIVEFLQMEVLDSNNLDKVRIDQKIVILYIYLYHPDLYSFLLAGQDIKDWQDGEEYSKKIKNILNSNPLRNEIPADFSKSPSSYFLYETPLNLSQKQVQELLSTKELFFEKLRLPEGPQFTEFTNYLLRTFTSVVDNNLDVIDWTFEFVREYSNGSLPLRKMLIHQMTRYFSGKDDDSDGFSGWIDILKKNNISSPIDQMECLMRLEVYSISELDRFFCDISDDDLLSTENLSATTILAYITRHDKWQNFSGWAEDTKLVNAILDPGLKNIETIKVFTYQGIFSEQGSSQGPFEYDRLEHLKKITYYPNVVSQHDMSDIEIPDNVKDIVDKKITILKEEGYGFVNR